MAKNKYKLEKNGTVNAYYYGHILEMTDTNPISKQSGIKPISKDEYVDLATGMTMKFKHQNQQRIQSPENLRKTFRNLRRLVIANFKAGDIWLLYPMNKNIYQLKDICYSSFDGVKVHVFFVDLGDIDNSMKLLEQNVLQQ